MVVGHVTGSEEAAGQVPAYDALMGHPPPHLPCNRSSSPWRPAATVLLCLWVAAGGGCASAPVRAVVEDTPAPKATASVASAATAAPDEPTAPAPEQLWFRWELKEVRYKNGRPSFVPERVSGITLDRRGGIGWTDGCNGFRGTYRHDGATFRISDVHGSLKACSFERDNVNYLEVNELALRGNRLELSTPTQLYILERFPYSRMSEHAWSLYAITRLATPETLSVDRFRSEYRQLMLEVKEDRTFVFTDLDHQQFSGTLEVKGEQISRMGFDQESRERLEKRGVEYGPLTDSTLGYKKTKESYPTTFALQIDWGAIESFAVRESPIEVADEVYLTDLLELRSKTHHYLFVPR